MAAPRDRHRLATYQAEDDAFLGTPMAEPVEFGQASRLIHDVIAHPWWQRRGCDSRPVTVGLGRSATTSWYRAADRHVQLSPNSLKLCTLTHELAHAGDESAGEASHGPTFRRLHIDVVALVAGRLPASQLEESYRSVGLPIGAPHPLSPLAHAVTILDPRPFNEERSTLILGRPATSTSADRSAGPIAL